MFTQDYSSPPVIKNDPTPDMPPLQIHMEGVLHLLLSLKISKATGPDKIPSRLLKELAYQISPVLTFIYCVSISQGLFRQTGNWPMWYLFLTKGVNPAPQIIDLSL